MHPAEGGCTCSKLIILIPIRRVSTLQPFCSVKTTNSSSAYKCYMLHYSSIVHLDILLSLQCTSNTRSRPRVGLRNAPLGSSPRSRSVPCGRRVSGCCLSRIYDESSFHAMFSVCGWGHSSEIGTHLIMVGRSREMPHPCTCTSFGKPMGSSISGRNMPLFPTSTHLFSIG
jgi:hypothetical protein